MNFLRRVISVQLGYMLRFGIVGAIGTFVNLFVFNLLISFLHSSIIASFFAFLAAVSLNFFLNAKWSFSVRTKGMLTSRSYVYYVLANTGGLLVNLFVLYNVSDVLGYNSMIGQFVGILCGMAVNYLASYYIVFK